MDSIPRHYLDAGIEQVSAPADRFDDALGLAKRTTDLHQALHQRVVGYGHVFPDGLHQLCFAHHAARVRHEMDEDVVRTGPQPDLVGSVNEKLTPRIECEVEKPVVSALSTGIRGYFGVLSASVRVHFVTQ